jgi:dTMP kinase
MSFVVIEGLDGSGKSTQIKLLKEFFKNNNIEFEFLHFPVIDSPIFGELIASFLRGDLGALEQVNPYVVALLYAGDRKNSASQIVKWQKEKKLVLTDRYVYSNIAYQCAKLSYDEEKERLYNWIFEMEYKYFGIPKPDINIFLDVPFEFTRKKLQEPRVGDERDYLKGKTDIHEDNLDFQLSVKETYLKAVERDENFISLKCYDQTNDILPPNQILNNIINIILNKHII